MKLNLFYYEIKKTTMAQNKTQHYSTVVFVNNPLQEKSISLDVIFYKRNNNRMTTIRLKTDVVKLSGRLTPV